MGDKNNEITQDTLYCFSKTELMGKEYKTMQCSYERNKENQEGGKG